MNRRISVQQNRDFSSPTDTMRTYSSLLRHKITDVGLLMRIRTRLGSIGNHNFMVRHPLCVIFLKKQFGLSRYKVPKVGHSMKIKFTKTIIAWMTTLLTTTPERQRLFGRLIANACRCHQ